MRSTAVDAAEPIVSMTVASLPPMVALRSICVGAEEESVCGVTPRSMMVASSLPTFVPVGPTFPAGAVPLAIVPPAPV